MSGNRFRQRRKITVPPFTGSVDAEDIDNSLKAIVDSKQTELLFVALFLRMLKTGGRCACIVPNGVLFRTNSKAYRQLRRELVDNQKLEAIIYMPSGVFKPYSGVSTAILVFTKTDAGGTERPFFPPDRPIVDSIGFDDMTNWHMTQYDELDMASIINDKPQQVRVSFHLMLGIKASAIIGGSTSVNDSTIGQIIRNVQMMQLDYKAKIKVRMPFEVSITNMVYDYTLDIGEGLSSINLDSIISQISEESSVDVKNATFTLVTENGIPLELSLQARFLDANNNLLFKLFNGDTNIAPAPTRILEIDTIRNLDNSIRQIDTIYESSGFSPVKELTATLSQRKIEQLKETKGLKVSFRMNTSAGKIVAIKRSDMLKLRAYIKFHPKIVIDIPIVTEPLLK